MPLDLREDYRDCLLEEDKMAVSFPSMRKLGDLHVHTIKTNREVTNIYAKKQVDSTDPSHTSPHKKPISVTLPRQTVTSGKGGEGW